MKMNTRKLKKKSNKVYRSLSLSLSLSLCICIHTYIYIYMYVYIYREREREREREIGIPCWISSSAFLCSSSFQGSTLRISHVSRARFILQTPVAAGCRSWLLACWLAGSVAVREERVDKHGGFKW